MKIAIDARELEGKPTGAGRFLLEVMRRWPSEFFLNNEVHLLFKNEIPLEVFPDSIPVRKAILKKPFFLNSDIFWEQVLLPFYLNSHSMDIFWGANGAVSFWRPRNLRVIVNIFDTTFCMNRKWYSFKERCIRKLRIGISALSADIYVTASQSAARDLERFFPKLKGKVQVIYPGADHLGSAKKHHRVTDVATILYVGSFLNRRPIENLIEAFRRLAPRYSQLKLRLVGDNRTSPRKDFSAVIRRSGLEGRIEWRGYCDEATLNNIYAEADIFCYPSLYEGFGIPVVEAQILGLPVVTLRNSSLEEVGRDSVIYAKSSDPGDLKEAIKALVDNASLYESIQRKGFENARQYQWSRTAGALLEIFRQTQ